MTRQTYKMAELIIDLFVDILTGNGNVYLHRFITRELFVLWRKCSTIQIENNKRFILMYSFGHFLKTQRCLKGVNIPVWHILRVLCI